MDNQKIWKYCPCYINPWKSLNIIYWSLNNEMNIFPTEKRQLSLNGNRPVNSEGFWLFLIYINDFPFSIKKLAQPILFADDTSIIISNSSSEEFRNNIISVLNETITWFNRNFLTLNCDKTHFTIFS
jgi:hypothetical protein